MDKRQEALDQNRGQFPNVADFLGQQLESDEKPQSGPPRGLSRDMVHAVIDTLQAVRFPPQSMAESAQVLLIEAFHNLESAIGGKALSTSQQAGKLNNIANIANEIAEMGQEAGLTGPVQKRGMGAAREEMRVQNGMKRPSANEATSWRNRLGTSNPSDNRPDAHDPPVKEKKLPGGPVRGKSSRDRSLSR